MSDRAASEVLSFALVFGLVVTSVAIVSVSGLGTLEATRDGEQMNNAERAFDVLADNMADLYQQGAPSRATELKVGDAQLEFGDHSEMNVSVTKAGDANPTPVLNRTMRPIIYEGSQDRQLVYEGGAVFREDRNGGRIVHEPPLVVTGNHVLYTFVGTRSNERASVGGSTVLVRSAYRGSTVRFENTSADVESVTVDVTSPRAGSWADYFESIGFDCGTVGADVSCEYDPSGTIDSVYVVDHDIRLEVEL